MAFGDIRPQARIAKSWVSRCYGRREPALVADFEVEASGAQEFTTFIIPSGKRHVAFVEERVVGAPAARAFNITCGRTVDVALTADISPSAASEPLGASGSVVWGRFVNGRFVKGCLLGGSSLEAGNVVSGRSIQTLQPIAIHPGPDRCEDPTGDLERIYAALREAAAATGNETAFRVARDFRTPMVERTSTGRGWSLLKGT